jgi:hypothetical protein
LDQADSDKYLVWRLNIFLDQHDFKKGFCLAERIVLLGKKYAPHSDRKSSFLFPFATYSGCEYIADGRQMTADASEIARL